MLEKLLQELNGIKLDDPEVVQLIDDQGLEEPEETDQLVGQLDEQQIKLRVLILQLTQQLEWRLRKHGADHLNPDTPDHSEEECKFFFATEIKPLEARIQNLNNLFWVSVKLDFDLCDAERVGLASNWQVVKKQKQDEPFGLEVLKIDLDEILGMLGRGQQPKRRRFGPFGG